MNVRVWKPASLLLFCGLVVGCGRYNDSSSSEIATSAVSGALNNTEGSAVAFQKPIAPPRSKIETFIEAVNPIQTAWAATWNCTGGELTPAFIGDGIYQYTPVSCSVTWAASKTSSVVWSGPFTLEFAGGCNTLSAFVETQSAGCSLKRTTPVGGVTRSLVGPRGGTYAVTHDTNGLDTGWDTAVTPAPSNNGVVVACGTGGCAANRTLTINGTHLTGTLASANGNPVTIWDHTVSTGTTPITVTGTGTSRTVNGTVNVQLNRMHGTATTAFTNVVFGQAGCCFPTSGSVTTTFTKGTNVDKTETLEFTSVCGNATLTEANGDTQDITLQHCL